MKIKALLFIFLLPSLAIAEDQSAIAVSLGGYDILDTNGIDSETVQVGIEYRFAPLPSFYDFIPTVGAEITFDGAYWLYTGVRYDWSFKPKWTLTPHFALAAYEAGGGYDLGHGLEFRFGADLGYQLTEKSRLALGYTHMSNAHLGDENPGADSVLLTYSRSLDF